MAMASFPFTNNGSRFRSSTTPPHANGDIGTDFSADGASRARFAPLPRGAKIAELIHLFPDPYELLGTRNGAESASLASITIYFDLSQHSVIILRYSPLKFSNILGSGMPNAPPNSMTKRASRIFLDGNSWECYSIEEPGRDGPAATSRHR
jgi:hypothetical protein